MVSKIFLDANVLLDLMLNRAGNEHVKTIFKKVIEGRYRAFISTSIIHIVSYYTSKQYGVVKAKELLLIMLNDIEVIDIDKNTVIKALNSNFNDIEDSLQYFCAIQHKIDAFITSDKSIKKLEIPVLPVYTPAMFLQLHYHD